MKAKSKIITRVLITIGCLSCLLALIAMYIMSAGLLILYNMGVELLMYQSSCSSVLTRLSYS